jgi:hypothetical protein
MADKREPIVPEAREGLEKLKLEVANETLGRDMQQEITEDNYEQALAERKWEAAEDLGLKEKIEDVGWENMTTREVGKIGGHVGGKIGGNMVKELIEKAESQMAPVADEAMPQAAKDRLTGGG